ncbi:MAG: FkbM family methyltransferase [Pseudomonadales bacterium]|nr:FkbM family methyltransferase [Pseudomonadales bacterium]
MSQAPTQNKEVEIPIRTTAYEGKELRYRTPNSLTEWRVDSLFLEEPDTVRWLSCMKEGEVLIDIGANVGMYSTLAAAGRGMQVYAFEPESQNHSLLNQNIYLNDLSDKVTAYCVGLSDTSGLSKLYLGHMDAGGAFHSSGEALDFNLEPLHTPFVQGCILMTLDQMVEDGTIPMPDHIKLDVDGFEYKVVNGMMNTIRNSKVKSVAIELNPNLPEHQQVFEQMAELGFTYFENQRAESCLEEGPFRNIGNVIFYRAPWPEYEELYQRQIGPMRVEKSIGQMLKNIAKNSLQLDSEKTVLIENVFPEEFYQNLLNNLPNENLYDSIGGTSLKTFKLDASYINRLPGSEIPFWSQLSYELGSTELAEKIVEVLAGKLPQLDIKQQRFGVAIVCGEKQQLRNLAMKSAFALCFNLDGSNNLLASVEGGALENIDNGFGQQMLLCTMDR